MRCRHGNWTRIIKSAPNPLLMNALFGKAIFKEVVLHMLCVLMIIIVH